MALFDFLTPDATGTDEALAPAAPSTGFTPRELMAYSLISQAPALKNMLPLLLAQRKQQGVADQAKLVGEGITEVQGFMGSGDFDKAGASLARIMPLLGAKGLPLVKMIGDARDQARTRAGLLKTFEGVTGERPELKAMIENAPIEQIPTLLGHLELAPQKEGAVVAPWSKQLGRIVGPGSVIPSAATVAQLEKIPGFAAYAGSKGVRLDELTNDLNSGDPARAAQAMAVTQVLAQAAPEYMRQQELATKRGTTAIEEASAKSRSLYAQQIELGTKEQQEAARALGLPVKPIGQYTQPEAAAIRAEGLSQKVKIAGETGARAQEVQREAKQEETYLERTINKERVIYDRETRMPISEGLKVKDINRLFTENKLVSLTPKDDSALKAIRSGRQMVDQLAAVSEEVLRGVKPIANYANALRIWASGQTGGSAMVAAFEALQGSKMFIARTAQGGSQGLSNVDVVTTSGLVPSKWDSAKSGAARIKIGVRMMDSIEKALLQEPAEPISKLIDELKALDREGGIKRSLNKKGELVEERKGEKIVTSPATTLTPGGRKWTE